MLPQLASWTNRESCTYELNAPDKDIDASRFEVLEAVSRVEKLEDGFKLYTGDENTTLQELVRLADREELKVSNLRTESSNLDDVFLALTGREMRE